MTKAVNQYTIRELLMANELKQFAGAADLLPVANPMLTRAPFLKANNGWLHKRPVNITPEVENSRKFNEGAKVTIARHTPVIAGIGINEEHLVRDDAFEMGNPNDGDWLLADEQSKIKSVGLGVGNRMLYADETVDDSIGFMNWFGKLDEAFYGDQIIDAGGVAANGLTSIWIICWAPGAVYNVYPEGAGIPMKMGLLPDKQQTDGDGGVYAGSRMQYAMFSGMFVENPFYVVRIANIPTTASGLATFDIIEHLDNALLRLDPMATKLGDPVIYMNQTLIKKYKDDVRKADKAAYSKPEIQTSATLAYDGIPIERIDLIRNAEAQVA